MKLSIKDDWHPYKLVLGAYLSSRRYGLKHKNEIF